MVAVADAWISIDPARRSQYRRNLLRVASAQLKRGQILENPRGKAKMYGLFSFYLGGGY